MVALRRTVQRPQNPLIANIPDTDRKYGVIFGVNGQYDKPVQVDRLPRRSLAVAVLHVIQYEEGFSQFDATGHIIDLTTGHELTFDRLSLLNDKSLVLT